MLGSDELGVILVAGDSTAYGTGVSDPNASVAGRIAADYPGYSIQNISENGATTHRLLQLLKATTLRDTYDLIVLQIGANDILQNRDDVSIQTDLDALLRLVRERTAHAFVLTSGNVGAAPAYVKAGKPDPRLEAKTRRVREVFRSVAHNRNATYVDLFEEPEVDVFFLHPDIYVAIDGLHPNAQGYGVWYAKLKSSLAQNKLLLK